MDDSIQPEKMSPSSKAKKKSHGLCSILTIRKKRNSIGCLPINSSLSLEGDEYCNKNPTSKEPANDETVAFQAKSSILLLKSKSEESSSAEEYTTLNRSQATISKSSSSTNVALCCAITESSRTPLHFQSDFRTRCNKSISNNRRSIVTRMNGQHSEELNERLPPSGIESKLKKPSSESNLSSSIKKSDITRRSIFGRNKKTHKRSFSLGKSNFSDEENKIDTFESSHSCEISPQSSPSPVETSHARLRRRLLLSQRRSADNIVASSSGSSPGSTRSIPDAKTFIKKKNRPSSVVIMGSQDEKRDISMDSLARQSLLAAQVLHLIPTNKARERNFLHGRIAANSLLGSIELEKVLPQRAVRIYIGTWNMNGQPPPAELNPLILPEDLDHLPDILALGTQESYPEKFQWEVSVQETLGPTHVLFHSVSLGTLHQAIFMRRDLLWYCSVAEDDSYSVRPGTAFRTKGAVAIGFSLFGTSLLFITAHLTAHQEKVKERLQDVKRIVKALELPKQLPIKHKSKDVTQNFDCVFWSGDLNFRLSKSRDEVMDWLLKQEFPVKSPTVGEMWDQLTANILEGSVFREFEEGPLTFAPTYKYDPGTQTYDSSQKQRTPSYTDRILYKTRRNGSDLSTKCLAYASVPCFCTSDHKPVWGLFRCHVRPGIDTIPLAAGMFNRDVYVEAIKRRAAALGLRGDNSTVCSLQ
uniref:phosphoinositide 5-phosphatase n=3 Tax=Clastoptera arizonana TaxID=38151 RepID=A0A1B6E485_9HEMI